MSVCTVPVKPEDITGDGRWLSMHNRYVSETKTTEPEVVFIGDSIIQGLQFCSLWVEKISSLHCVNFGIGGDKVQHLLWRLQNGEMDFHIKIKAVVLFAGTNNTEDSPEQIFEGICECIKTVKAKLGDVHVILPTLLPRGQLPNKLREKNNAVNKLMSDTFNDANSGDWTQIHVVPIHENILQSDQTISHYIMHDYLHLTDEGYTKTFIAVYEKLRQIIQNQK